MRKIDPEIEALVKLFGPLKKKTLKRGRRGNPNPKGSAPRYRWDALFKSAKQGQSVWDYISARGNPKTLKNAMRGGYIELV
jgi:hypothetical protein